MSTSQRAEATRKAAAPVGRSVMWRGKRFKLPTPAEMPLEALEAEEDGKHLTALKLILGVDQYRAFRDLAATAADAEDFSEQVMRELGRGNA
ncbi:hypothetical protein ACFQ1S_23025 [Kibdelosporangium lantanae]|uniref:Uncharacterized protein n=1 Tax=Kibdelosporangium lantanae TaxID=1497396 RepID=A0ABW3MD07_9PSEU